VPGTATTLPLELSAVIRGHGDIIAHAVLSDDGRRLLTASWDGYAQVFDLATPRMPHVFDPAPHLRDRAVPVIGAIGSLGRTLGEWADLLKPAEHVFLPGDTSLTKAQEQRLRPGDSFRECIACPPMVVVSAGSFTMGSPAAEVGRFDDEGPAHAVTFRTQFAVGRFAVTFDEWDACASDGGCDATSLRIRAGGAASGRLST
jgi:formylglycine-generating enzyme required for sulfatase activity